MRILFKLDTKDYDPNGRAFIRPSVRGIIIRNGKAAMVHSLKYDYYKFPGGGIEPMESHIDALIREVREESGLQVIRDTVREYGCVPRIQKSDRTNEYDVFIQDNFYYTCEVKDAVTLQELDDYEQDERFTPEWAEPQVVIEVNLSRNHGSKNQVMIEREAMVLRHLIKEGCLARRKKIIQGSSEQIRSHNPPVYFPP